MRMLVDALMRNAAADGECAAFQDAAGTLSRSVLARRVAGLAAELAASPARTIGLFAPNGADWAIGFLAAAAAGRIVVPLPTFFSPAQLGHVVRDASVDLLLATQETWPRALRSGIRASLFETAKSGDAMPSPVGEFRQIIYTSGTTGAPKGVVHGEAQLGWQAKALASATEASADDLYLSVLPLPLLLESLCAIVVPTLVGASTRFDAQSAAAIGRGVAPRLADLFEDIRPTTSVLVPQLLKSWSLELSAHGATAPSSLRFVAVGGAPVAPRLAEEAWALGIPVHEGYGLSECCSVVAMNRPGERSADIVGRPLDGLSVEIDDGEIVVEGPPVMSGYLGRPPAPRRLRTGDLGAFDDAGRLKVLGRKDSLIVTAFGRNVSPEWVESEVCVSSRIALCAVTGHGEPVLSAVIVPTALAEPWFRSAGAEEIEAFCRRLCADLPAYATPERWETVSLEEAIAEGLVNAAGALNRGVAARILARRTPRQDAA